MSLGARIMKKENSTKKTIRKTVIAALLTALTFVGTMIIQIPTGTNGYIHIGDCFVILCGYILGPVWGFMAAGVGSSLTDVATSYFFWAPGTFIIKGAMATIAYFLVKVLSKISRKSTLLPFIFASVVAELFMVAGYFVYAATILGEGLPAALSIPANLVQGIAGAVISTLLAEIFVHNKALTRLAPIIALKPSSHETGKEN